MNSGALRNTGPAEGSGRVQRVIDEPGVYRLDNEAMSTARDQLATKGWQVVELPRDINSATRFFHAIIGALRLDPSLSGRVNWDGLLDSLVGGLATCSIDRVVITWADPLTLADAEPRAYETALAVLTQVAADLAGVLEQPK